MHKIKHAVCGLVGLLATAMVGWGEGTAALPASILPEITVGACAQAPVMDGSLTDACWQTAAVVTNFHIFGQGDKIAAQKAMLTFDRQWLYLGFEIRHPNPSEIKPTVFKHDGPVHQDDSVEVFLDPGTDGALYYHFKLNAANTRSEQRKTKLGGLDLSWEMPWRSAAQRTQTGWNAEMAIPLSLLVSYGDSRKARLNLAVAVVVPVIDAQGVRVREDQQLLCWSPVVSGFHEPEHFGVLKGLANVKISDPFLPGFRNAKIGPYDTAGKDYAYGLNVEVFNASAQTGMVNVVVDDRPLSGQATSVTQTVALGAQQRQTLALKIPIAAAGERRVLVQLVSGANGEVLQSEAVDDVSALNIMTAYLDRSYYTDEAEAGVMCRFSLPPTILKDMTATAKDQAGRVVGATKDLATETRLGIGLQALSTGRHEIVVALCRSGGTPIASQTLSLSKLAPKPGREWKTDRVNRVVLHNGKPVFPCGVYISDKNGATDPILKSIAARGFNSVQYFYQDRATDALVQPAVAAAQLESAATNGLNAGLWLEACQSPSNITIGVKGWFCCVEKYKNMPAAEKKRIFDEALDANMDRMMSVIRSVKDNPALMSYYTFDEPCEKRYVDMTDAGRKLYRKVHEADGYHPIVLLYSSGIPEGDEYTDFGDILATDPYWVPAGSGNRGNVNFVSEITWRTKQRGDGIRHPIWIVPEAELWGGIHKRAILPQEQFCQTYLALIHGAKGLLYFTTPVLHQGSYDALSRVARELQVLGPVVVTPEIPQVVSYKPGEFNPDQQKYPDIQAALFRNPDGGYVLLTANSRYYPVDVTYTLSCLEKNGKIGRLFAKDTYVVKDGAFADRVEPFGVRAYLIGRQTPDAGGKQPARNAAHSAAGGSAISNQNENESTADSLQPTASIQIAVVMQAHPELAKAEEPDMGGNGRVGKKNLMYNPGFEEATLPGWPDYYQASMNGGAQIRTGNPGADFSQDPEHPFEGKYSLRMKKTKENVFWLMYTSLAPKNEKNEEYVISAWLRADQDGREALFEGFGWKKKLVLTKEWKRYYESGIPGGSFGLRMPGAADGGTIWIDAIQLEKGSEPTAFEP